MTGHAFAARLLTPGAFLLVTLAGCADRELPTSLEFERPAFAQLPGSPIVNSVADPGNGTCDETECTLREAIDYATAGATITFAVTGTITITTQNVFHLARNVTITGPGAASLAVSGNDEVVVFEIAPEATVSMSGLTITHGLFSRGAAIINEGTLSLADCAITDNRAVDGGGIYNHGILTVTRCTIARNNAAGWGVKGAGGGILNFNTLTISNSTISGNYAGVGGGIGARQLDDDVGVINVTTTIRNSTISGNTAEYRGGGVDNMDAWVRIGHSTIADNHVQYSDASNGLGGGGLQSYTGEAGVGAQVVGSIIWGNTGEGGNSEDVASVAGTGAFLSLGHNLVRTAGYGVDFSVDFNAAGDQTGVPDAQLGVLALNAPGNMATHGLLAGSPALDAGTCTGLDGETVTADQRGVSRPAGACDIGAHEGLGAGPALPPAPVPSSACSYQLNRNGSWAVTVTWANQAPGVTLVRLAGARTIEKRMAPKATGTLSLNLKSTATQPTYELFGGTSRRDARRQLVVSTACSLVP